MTRHKVDLVEGCHFVHVKGELTIGVHGIEDVADGRDARGDKELGVLQQREAEEECDTT